MDIFSNLQVVGECLLDKNRVEAFSSAISEVIEPGDVVIDCGTGSGIMSLLSARAGASKVYAVEIAEDVAQFAKENVDASPYKDIVQVINSDIKDIKFDKKVDVVVAEMLDTGLVAEQQAQAMNRLHELNVVSPKTKFIPYGVDNAIEAVEYDFNFYGFNMPFVIQARNFGAYEHVTKVLSPAVIYYQVNFEKPVDTKVSEIVDVTFTKNGLFNAIKLKTRTLLGPKTKVWGTSDMNMPVIIPVTPMVVKAGESVKVKIEYEMGEGFSNFFVDILK